MESFAIRAVMSSDEDLASLVDGSAATGCAAAAMDWITSTGFSLEVFFVSDFTFAISTTASK